MNRVFVQGGGGYEVRAASGKLRRRGRWRNAAATVGLNLMLNVMFRSGAASPNWYAGLIDNAGFTALAAGDTMASHAGWAENTGYTNGTRPQWSPGAASGGLLAAALTAFTMNNTFTIYGAFVCDSNVKGGTSGNLWATGGFDTPTLVNNADTITLTYETQLSAVS